MLFESGVLAVGLVSFWDKIQGGFWKVAGVFVCRWTAKGEFTKFGLAFVWDKLKRKRSLSPLYSACLYGSGEEQRMLIREIGFDNPRLIWIGWAPCLVTIGNSQFSTFYGLKPFISKEKIMLAMLEHYKNYTGLERDKNKVIRFNTQLIQGSLSKIVVDKKEGELSKSAANEDEMGFFHLGGLESFNLGRRVNYTANDYKNIVNLTEEFVRLIDCLYLPPEMRELRAKLGRWFKNKEWFIKRGLVWKRGILLHGEPGTGKTSTIVGMAQELDMPVIVFDLSTFTNDDFISNWHRLTYNTPCFVVLEDFDAVFDKRTNVANSSVSSVRPLSFDCVLNILDGALRYDGIVTFITTNNIDKIDPALGGGGCPSRVAGDWVYNMGGLDGLGKRFIAERIFIGLANEKDLISKALSVNCKTPAQFKEYCINEALMSYEEQA